MEKVAFVLFFLLGFAPFVHGDVVHDTLIDGLRRVVFAPTTYEEGLLGYQYVLEDRAGKKIVLNKKPVFPNCKPSSDHGLGDFTWGQEKVKKGLAELRAENEHVLDITRKFITNGIKEGDFTMSEIGHMAKTDFRMAAALGLGLEFEDNYRSMEVFSVDAAGKLTSLVTSDFKSEPPAGEITEFKIRELPGDKVSVFLRHTYPNSSVRMYIWKDGSWRYFKKLLPDVVRTLRDVPPNSRLKLCIHGPCSESLHCEEYKAPDPKAAQAAPDKLKKFVSGEDLISRRLREEGEVLTVKFRSNLPEHGTLEINVRVGNEQPYASQTVSNKVGKLYELKFPIGEPSRSHKVEYTFVNRTEERRFITSDSLFVGRTTKALTPPVVTQIEDDCESVTIRYNFGTFNTEGKPFVTAYFMDNKRSGPYTIQGMSRSDSGTVTLSKRLFGHKPEIPCVLRGGIQSNGLKIDGLDSKPFIITNSFTMLPNVVIEEFQLSPDELRITCANLPAKCHFKGFLDERPEQPFVSAGNELVITGKLVEAKQVRVYFESIDGCWRSNNAWRGLNFPPDHSLKVQMEGEGAEPRIRVFIGKDLLPLLDRLVINRGGILRDLPYDKREISYSLTEAEVEREPTFEILGYSTRRPLTRSGRFRFTKAGGN